LKHQITTSSGQENKHGRKAMATITSETLKSILERDTAKSYSDFYLVAAGLIFKAAIDGKSFNKNPLNKFHVSGLVEKVDYILFNGVAVLKLDKTGNYYVFTEKQATGTTLDLAVEVSEILTHFDVFNLVAKAVQSELGVSVNGSAWSLYFQFGDMGNCQHRFSNHTTNSGSPAANRRIVLKNGAAYLELPSVLVRVA